MTIHNTVNNEITVPSAEQQALPYSKFCTFISSIYLTGILRLIAFFNQHVIQTKFGQFVSDWLQNYSQSQQAESSHQSEIQEEQSDLEEDRMSSFSAPGRENSDLDEALYDLANSIRQQYHPTLERDTQEESVINEIELEEDLTQEPHSIHVERSTLSVVNTKLDAKHKISHTKQDLLGNVFDPDQQNNNQDILTSQAMLDLASMSIPNPNSINPIDTNLGAKIQSLDDVIMDTIQNICADIEAFLERKNMKQEQNMLAILFDKLISTSPCIDFPQVKPAIMQDVSWIAKDEFIIYIHELTSNIALDNPKHSINITSTVHTLSAMLLCSRSILQYDKKLMALYKDLQEVNLCSETLQNKMKEAQQDIVDIDGCNIFLGENMHGALSDIIAQYIQKQGVCCDKLRYGFLIELKKLAEEMKNMEYPSDTFEASLQYKTDLLDSISFQDIMTDHHTYELILACKNLLEEICSLPSNASIKVKDKHILAVIEQFHALGQKPSPALIKVHISSYLEHATNFISNLSDNNFAGHGFQAMLFKTKRALATRIHHDDNVISQTRFDRLFKQIQGHIQKT